MLKTNKDKLVKWALQGRIHHPVGCGYCIGQDGRPVVVPGVGGITYNVRVGDSAYGYIGDHVEPGVSLRNANQGENDALVTYSCVGNEVKIVTGDMKGKKGYVLGTHGGVDHLMVCFEDEVVEELLINDNMQVRAVGQGLAIEGYEDVHMMSLDPSLFEKMGIEEQDGKLIVPVTAKIPSHLMGSGIGSVNAYAGDYDLMTGDKDEIKRLGLDQLCLGDFVLLEGCDNTYGRGYLKDAVSVGIVMHCDCIKAGHGPGITTIMSCKTPRIEGRLDKAANIKNYMNIK